jgi:hypothetical protein
VKNVECSLCGSVLNCLAGIVQANGRTHRHSNRLHFRLGRLIRDVSYYIFQLGERQENGSERKG